MLRSFLKAIRQNARNLPPVSAQEITDELDFLDRAKEQLKVLEIIRKKKLAVFSFRKFVAIPLGFVLGPILIFADYWLAFFNTRSDDSVMWLTFLFLGGLYWWATQPRRDYAKAYKGEILPSLAKLFGNFDYDIEGKIPMSMMESSKIVPRHDKYESEDYFCGQYKGVDIKFSEINLKEKRRLKNSTYYVSIFRGLAIILDMKSKRFLGHTVLDYNKGKISEWFAERSLGLKRANLVDPAFEDRFDVYTNDQVEARYIIDPVMMERLNAMYEEYDGNKMAAAFYDSKMLILIASDHNYFEPAKLEISAMDPCSVLSMKREVEEILSIVDKLEVYDPYSIGEE